MIKQTWYEHVWRGDGVSYCHAGLSVNPAVLRLDCSSEPGFHMSSIYHQGQISRKILICFGTAVHFSLEEKKKKKDGLMGNNSNILNYKLFSQVVLETAIPTAIWMMFSKGAHGDKTKSDLRTVPQTQELNSRAATTANSFVLNVLELVTGTENGQEASS